MSLQFSLGVNYSQIIVATKQQGAIGLVWQDDHVAQGFAWHDKSVSFGMPDHDGQCWMDVDIASIPYEKNAAALWSIGVPFAVKSSPVVIDTIMGCEAKEFNLPHGTYQLIWEAYKGQGEDEEGFPYAFTIRLRFYRTSKPTFSIFKKGKYLQSDKILRRDAEIA